MSQFYFILNIVIFSRLFYGFKNEAVGKKRISFTILIQILALFFFVPSFRLFILFFLFILMGFIVNRLESKLKNLNAARLLTFILYLIIISFFASDSANLVYNKQLIKFLSGLKDYFYIFNLFERVNWQSFVIITTAVLFLLNESNYLIRFLFELFELTPFIKDSGNTAELDTKEYNAGRIIGMLERILIFIFLIADQYAAIGFIIAAKGFTRFKELEDRNFAEYVLIGTFLSALSAIIIALLVKIILQG